MSRRFMNLAIAAAMILGIFTGWLQLPCLDIPANFVSTLFLRLLQLISLPIIFFAVVATLSGMQDISEVRQMGKRVLGYTVLTTVIAASVALALFLLIDPVPPQAPQLEGVIQEAPQQASYFSLLTEMIPDNFVQAFSSGNVIGIVLMAIALGLGTLFLPTAQKHTLHQFFASSFALLLKLTQVLIVCMPVAIWAFVALLVRELQQHYENFHYLWYYLLCVVGANLIQGIVVLPSLLKWKKISPLSAFRAMSPALSMAFFSKSSNATLPLTMQNIETRAKVSKKISSFSLPLCTIINMNGCAAFILTTSLFVASSYGHVFSGFDYVCWILIATLAAIGNAGVPMGCFFLTSALLIGMNVPLYMMGLILPFYTILDMVETALNVWSDSCVVMIVDKDLSTQTLPEAVETPQSIA